MSRHERRTGCLAPPPLPNSELFCQVERGEEVKLELEVLPIKDVSYVLFSLQLFFLPLKEKCSGVQGQVWRGEGESVSLCQVTDDVVHCSCLCYLNAEADHYRKPNIRCERDRSGWEARWSRLLLPCRQTCRWNGLKTNTVLTRVSFLSTFLSRLSVPRVRGGTVECSEIGEDRMQCNLR